MKTLNINCADFIVEPVEEFLSPEGESGRFGGSEGFESAMSVSVVSRRMHLARRNHWNLKLVPRGISSLR